MPCAHFFPHLRADPQAQNDDAGKRSPQAARSTRRVRTKATEPKVDHGEERWRSQHRTILERGNPTASPPGAAAVAPWRSGIAAAATVATQSYSCTEKSSGGCRGA